jgi:adenosylhomocysteine nucleosidase
MMLLVFATELEAQPFIDYHRLRRLEAHQPCPAYEGERLLLIISGMGFLKGAVTLLQVLQKHEKSGNPITRVINYGIAGSLTGRFSLGEVVPVDSVVKYNPVEFTKKRFNKFFASAFPEIRLNERAEDAVVLATSDHPILTEDDARLAARYAHLVDMEGYGYAFVAGNFGIPIQLIKGVSDFARKESEDSFRKQVKKSLEALLAYHIRGVRSQH